MGGVRSYLEEDVVHRYANRDHSLYSCLTFVRSLAMWSALVVVLLPIVVDAVVVVVVVAVVVVGLVFVVIVEGCAVVVLEFPGLSWQVAAVGGSVIVADVHAMREELGSFVSGTVVDACVGDEAFPLIVQRSQTPADREHGGSREIVRLLWH